MHTRAQWTASQKPARAISPEHKPIPMHGEALHVTQHSEILKQRIQKGKALSNSSTWHEMQRSCWDGIFIPPPLLR